MFTGGIGAVSLASYVDPTKPRLQPERPTSVDLPDYSILTNNAPADWTNEDTRPDFRRKYTQLKKPSDINGELLDDFNIVIATPSPVDELVPRDHDGRSFLPDTSNDDSLPRAEVTQNNQVAFKSRQQELEADNDIAYRTVCREKLPEGVTRIRLANFRNFFSALEGMSEHWETDLDHYFIAGQDNYQDALSADASPALEPIPEHETGPRSVSAADMFREDAPTGKTTSTSILTGFKDGASTFSFAQKDTPMRDAAEEVQISPTTLSGMLHSNGSFPFRAPPPRSSSMDSITSSSSSEADIPIPMYRGRRISSGIKMPGLYRTETVKGFLEGAVYHFNCRLSPPRAPATLSISGVRVPVRHQTFLVHRIPTDRAIARLGVAEGPVMGSFVRQNVEAFSQGTEEERKERLRLDLLKEMSCLLHIAQERRRDGREERPWTKKIPKGGHWFSEMASDNSKPDECLPDLDMEVDKVDGTDRRRKKVKTKYDTWKEMQPQRPVWDPKVKYTAVGKEEGSEWDEVYMLSSMYHHVSIVKVRIHGAYVDYLTDGVLPNPLPEDAKWCQPVMQRSQWFNMFNIPQRVEAFRCLWGVMCYLTRQSSKPSAGSR